MNDTKVKKIKKLKAKVLKNSKDKTVLVELELLKIDPLYQKRYFSHRKIQAHTEKDLVAGQEVKIQERRPISRHKAWEVIEVKE